MQTILLEEIRLALMALMFLVPEREEAKVVRVGKKVRERSGYSRKTILSYHPSLTPSQVL